MKEKIRENGEKIKQNKVLPYLVSNVVEVGLQLPVVAHPAQVYRRFWTWTLKPRTTERTETRTRRAKGNAR